MTAKLPEEWEPEGIDELEPAALAALRDDAHTCVTAGPGAGKTEFLAQRASYLLETGLCPAPRRILAISFKRSAAANLQRRVQQRTPEHANRFVSMTFDAFTKSIVDQFRALLPEPWAMNGNYEIGYAKTQEVAEFLDALGRNTDPAMLTDLHGISPGTFLAEKVAVHALPAEPTEPATPTEYAVHHWWLEKYRGKEAPVVDFIMLNRLAELIIRNSAHLQSALQQTYPVLFIDEFQDTTYAQYSFLRAAFAHQYTTITTVGDSKQRIMGWAGALGDAFTEFRSDFSANHYELTWNFRSTEALVDLQHRFAQKLDPSAARAVSKAVADIADEPARIWSFSTLQKEAATVAAWIAADMETSGRKPDDYALVARQKVAELEGPLRSALNRYGIQLRNDDALFGQLSLQDLLKDEYSRLLVGVLKLAATEASAGGQPRTWLEVSSKFAHLRGAETDMQSAGSDNELSTFLQSLRQRLRENPFSAHTIDLVHDQISRFLNDSTAGHMSMVDRPEDITVRADAFKARFRFVATESESWSEAVDAYEGNDAISLLTIHRSKGLEYHTVFFLGLDDDQWWSHGKDPTASTSAFFVGLSRAAQRIIFTQCDERGGQVEIEDLYEILDDGGLQVSRIE